MPYDVDIEVTVDGFIKDLRDFTKHLRRNSQHALDKNLDLDMDELKSQLLTVLNEDIRVSSTVTGKTTNIPEKLNIPKIKADIIKEVFGQDIKNSEVFKSGATLDDTSSVFVLRNNRLKAWQSVSDSSTYEGQESIFRNRIKEGIIIDSATGKLYKVNPKNIKGLKLECSKDTGQTLDSSKKFDAYKKSSYVSRRKNNAPYDRTAVWTVRQEDVQNMMQSAIPLDGIIEKLQEGEYEVAKNILQQHNSDKSLDSILEKIETLKTDDTGTDINNYKVIRQMINNLKLRKEQTSSEGVEGTTTYVLVTNYDRQDSEEEINFFTELKNKVWLWMSTNEHKWFVVMVKAVEKAILKYDSKAKYI